jgi:ABC-type sugar transport system permease subunit
MWRSSRLDISTPPIFWNLWFAITQCLPFVIGFGLAVLHGSGKIPARKVCSVPFIFIRLHLPHVTGHVWAWIMNPAYGLEGT